MNKINPRKLILSNVLVALALFAFLIWMVTSGLDVITVYGATRQIPYTYDTGVFNITDLSIKEGDYSTDIIGFIQNVDPYLRTIKGVSLKIEMYDRNNHLIDVTDTGYSSLPDTFNPDSKYAFKVPIDKNNELDHLHIQILATDWGTAAPQNTPDLSSETNRTFTDCYSDAAKDISSKSLTVPTKLRLNVTDPEINKTLTNMCNFYHEKSGLWINITDPRYQDTFDQYAQEYFQKYGSTFPESFKQFMEYVTNPSTRPHIGILGLSLTPDLSKQIGLNQTKGFLITSITEGSPAQKYGLKAGSIPTTYNGRVFYVGGDVILKIDNQSISKIEDILSYTIQKHVGDKVHLTILRDNAVKELDLILGQQPNQPIPPIDNNNGNPQDLYDQCVSVAGKSFCDYLFK
jgi:hypothetical protein